MISILVTREPGVRPGPDISDPLIVSEAMAIARGTVEIDKSFSNRILISGDGPLTELVKPGAIVSVGDMESGNYVGMVRSYSIKITRNNQNFNADTAIEIEKEA